MALAGEVVIDAVPSYVKSQDAGNGLQSSSVLNTESSYTIGDFGTASATVIVSHSLSYLQLNARVQELDGLAESYVEFQPTADLDYTFSMLTFLPQGDFEAELGVVGANINTPIHSFAGAGSPFTGSLLANGTTYYLKTSMTRTIDGGFGLVETRFDYGPALAIPLPQPFVMASVGVAVVAFRRQR